MERLQAFKYELRPDGAQARQMRRFAGACRFVYNKALSLQQQNYAAGGKFIGYVAMAKQLTAWRNGAETPWLKDAPVHPLQHALKDLEKAFKNFFEKRTDFPCFKKKGQSDSFRYPDPKQIKLDQANGRIFLPKLGWLRQQSAHSAGCEPMKPDGCLTHCPIYPMTRCRANHAAPSLHMRCVFMQLRSMRQTMSFFSEWRNSH